MRSVLDVGTDALWSGYSRTSRAIAVGSAFDQPSVFWAIIDYPVGRDHLLS